MPEAMCHATLSFSEVSDCLKILKSIDKIVVVDDVRKYGLEELERLREELKEDDKEN